MSDGAQTAIRTDIRADGATSTPQESRPPRRRWLVIAWAGLSYTTSTGAGGCTSYQPEPKTSPSWRTTQECFTSR